jgi:hypothetical protein
LILKAFTVGAQTQAELSGRRGRQGLPIAIGLG